MRDKVAKRGVRIKGDKGFARVTSCCKTCCWVTMRFSTRFDPAVLRAIKAKAVRHHTTVPGLIDVILRGWSEEGTNRYP